MRPTLITISGQFLKIDGTPEIGMLIFNSPVLSLYSSDSIGVVPSRKLVALDNTGSFEVQLPATDDPAWIPQGWKYSMTLRLSEDYATYEVSVPYDSVNQEMSIAELIPVQGNLPTPTANYAPAVHTHTAADIVSGTIAMARLPVGLTHSTVAYGDHTHPGLGGDINISDVIGLVTALNAKAAIADLKTVAFTGSYNDLTDKPAGGGAVNSVAGRTGDVVLTKSDVGLSNVDNTSDANKPISTATQTALSAKVNTSSLATVATSGSYTDLTNKPTIPTIPVTSVAGKTGDVTLAKIDVGLSNVDNTSDTSKPVSTAQQSALDLKANLASPTFTGTVSGITKSMVGLANVDNTSDANKPVSSAVQTALDLKAPLASPTFTGTVSGISKSMVGLGNVDNTSDTNKPISSATQTALNAKANTSNLATVATSGSYVDLTNKPIQVWNGTAYAASNTAQIYVGPNDPGSVPDGSVWIQVP